MLCRRNAVIGLLLTANMSGCAALSVQAPEGVVIPDGASTVVVSGVSLSDARTSLIRQGWTVARFDAAGGVIQTEPWTRSDGMNPVRITVNALPDGSLVFRGQWKYGRYSKMLLGNASQLEGWNAAEWNDNGNARQAFLYIWRVASNVGREVEFRR